LQWNDEVHESDHERHGDEENHHRAVRGEDLVVVFRRQVSRGIERQCLLRSHQQRVDEPAQQHHQCQQDVHDADALVIDAGDPFLPNVREMSLENRPPKHTGDGDGHDQ